MTDHHDQEHDMTDQHDPEPYIVSAELDRLRRLPGEMTLKSFTAYEYNEAVQALLYPGSDPITGGTRELLVPTVQRVAAAQADEGAWWVDDGMAVEFFDSPLDAAAFIGQREVARLDRRAMPGRRMTDTDWAALADALEARANFVDPYALLSDEDLDNMRAAAVGLRRLAQLDTAIRDRHTPEEQEAEVWWGDADHDQRFPDCLSGDDCEGHVTTITVCSECGYTHDGETPIFRQWPCPTLAAVAARDFGTGNPTATSEDDQR